MFKSKLVIIFVALFTLIVAIGYGVGYQASQKFGEALLNDIKVKQAIFSPGTVETSFGFFKAKAVVKDSKLTVQHQEFSIPVIETENKWHRIVTTIPDITMNSSSIDMSLQLKNIVSNNSIFDTVGNYNISDTKIEINVIEVVSYEMSILIEDTTLSLDNDSKKQAGKGAINIAAIKISKTQNANEPSILVNNLGIESGYQIDEKVNFKFKFGLSKLDADIKEEKIVGETKDLNFDVELNAKKQILDEFNKVVETGFAPETFAASLMKYNIKVSKMNFMSESSNLKSPYFKFTLGKVNYNALSTLKQPDQEEAIVKGKLDNLNIDTNDFQLKLDESTLTSSGTSDPRKVEAFNQYWSTFFESNDVEGLATAVNDLIFNAKGDFKFWYKNLTVSNMQGMGLNSPSGKLDFGFTIKEGILDLDLNPAISLNQLDNNPMIAMFLPIKTLEKDLKFNIRQLDIGTIISESIQTFKTGQPNLKSNSENLVKVSQKSPGIGCNLTIKTDQNIELLAETRYDLSPLPKDFDLQNLLSTPSQGGIPVQLISGILDHSKIKLGLKILEYETLLKLTDSSMIGGYVRNMKQQYGTFLQENGKNLEGELIVENGNKAILNGKDVSHMLKAFGL